MKYTTDGFNCFQEFDSLEDAIEASKNAPWANGGVFTERDGSSKPNYIIEPTRFEVEDCCQ